MRACREWLGLAVSALLAATPALAQDRCAACHASLGEPRLRAPATLVSASVHRAGDLGCASCHGGRRGEPTVAAHDPASGFVARPTAAETVERCGTCHADARFMRRHRSSAQVDQLALFRQDPHGRAIARGAVGAASCVSCHGAHDVQPSHDPTSRTHPSRVSALCGGCHSAPARVDRAREAPGPLWLRSVHGEALAGGNARAPSCASCHGAHGERVEAGGAAASCGGCHVEEAQRSARGPHGAAFERLGFGPCGPCHGAHDVAPAADRLLGVGGDASCVRCHAAGQRAYGVAQRLAASHDDATAAGIRARDAARSARSGGAEPAGIEASLRALHTAESRLRSAAHSLDEGTMRDASAAVQSIAAQIEGSSRASLARREVERRQWRYALGPLGLLLVLLLLKLRRLEREA